ncbi:MAG: hypothetical protein AABX31_01355 [Nanoarchaeota archaeon]
MPEWKPDTTFLDFLLVKYAAGDTASEEMIEDMRAGETPHIQNIYKLVYDMFKEEYKVHQAIPQLKWSSN